MIDSKKASDYVDELVEEAKKKLDFALKMADEVEEQDKHKYSEDAITEEKREAFYLGKKILVTILLSDFFKNKSESLSERQKELKGENYED